MSKKMITLVLLGGCFVVSADTIVLGSGRAVQGKIIDDRGSTVVFQSASGKRYRLARARLKSVRRSPARGTASAEEPPPSPPPAEPATPAPAPAPTITSGPVPEMVLAPRIAPQLGLSFSGMSTNQSVSLDSRTGLLLGVSVELMRLYRFLYLQPELNYEQLGFSFSFLGASSTLQYDVIRMPLLLKARGGVRGESDPLQFVGLFGLAPALRIHANSHGVSSSGTATDADASKGTHSFSLALEFGGGAEYAVAPGIVAYANLRFALGLTNVLAPSTGQPDVSAQTRDWQLVGGVGFEL